MKYCIAYDGSAEAEGALQLLQLLFREKEDSLVVYHGYQQSDEEAHQRRSQAVADATCRSLVRWLEASWRDAPIQVVVEDCWDVKQQLVMACGAHRCDFLVMGSRGLGFVERTLVGSVSTYALNNFEGYAIAISRAPTPLSPQAALASSQPGHRFLVFLDGSGPAERALQLCCRLLRSEDTVDVVSIFECPDTATPANQAEDVVADANKGLMAESEAAAHAVVDAAVQRLRQIAREKQVHRVAGHVFGAPDVKRGIAEFAEAQAALDGPVPGRIPRAIGLMGSRGRGLMARIFLGSCTNYFLHNCTVPLIAVH
eukprot:EG_transcript_15147